MNKAIVFFLTLSLLLLPRFNFVASFIAAEYKIDKIVIDAGHGGKDPGALGGHSREKDITLAVSLKLGEYIKEYLPDVEVLYTRDKDVFVPLVERGNFANKHKADFFISVHINSFPKPTVKGSEVYVLGLHKTEENLNVAKRENAVILMEEDYEENYGGFDPNKPESHILLSMFQNAYMEQSIKYAQMLEAEFKTRAKRPTRGVKQAGFVVLNQTTMPSVLVELGFLTNQEEERYLLSENGQSYMASAMYRSFRDYKERIEKSTLEGITIDPEGQPESKEPVLAELETSEEKVKSATPEVLFKIQFCATKKVLEKNDKRLEIVDSFEIEKIESGYNRYLTGAFTNYKDAIAHRDKLRANGLRDAYVTAYKEGKRVSVNQVLNAQKK
ncbi:MAG: N-acetylmuramoyl-L-alanine amidase [Chitinophagales bacterium]